MPTRPHRVALIPAVLLTILAAGCGDSTTPTTPTAPTAGSPTAALMACPASVNRQSLDALPMRITWELPTVAGIPVDKGSCSTPSGTPFPIGTSTVSCTADQPTLAASCSFSITITPPDTRLRFTKYMAFGDSITAGFVGDAVRLPAGMTAREIPALLRAAGGRAIPGISSAVQPSNAYPAQLQSLLAPGYPTQQITVANEGLSGERVGEAVTRFPASLLSVQPEVVLLFEGFNDIDSALLNRGGEGSPIDVRPIRDDLFTMALHAQEQGIEVLLATLTPVTDVREEADPGTREAILALNTLIRGIAVQLHLSSVIDLYSALDGIPGMIGADGFHPTVTGYRRMAEIFSAAIVSRHDITPRPPVLTATP